MEKRKRNRCCVVDCESTNKEQHFVFPRDVHRAEQWAIGLGLDYVPNYNSFVRVCEKHFESDAFTRNLKAELLNLPKKRLLLPTAIPALNLPTQRMPAAKADDVPPLYFPPLSLLATKANDDPPPPTGDVHAEQTDNDMEEVDSSEVIDIKQEPPVECVLQEEYEAVPVKKEDTVDIDAEHSDSVEQDEDLLDEYLDELGEMDEDLGEEEEEDPLSVESSLTQLKGYKDQKFIVWDSSGNQCLRTFSDLANPAARPAAQTQPACEALQQQNQKLHKYTLKYACDQCTYSFRSYDHLLSHKESIHGVLLHNGVYIGPDPAQTEAPSLSANGIYSCDECKYFATQPSSLEKHKEYAHPSRRAPAHQVDKNRTKKGVYGCDLCTFFATQPSGLVRHKETTHDVIVSLACRLCDFVASSTRELRAHRVYRHNEKRYSCDQCDSKFTESNHLTAHIQAIHEGVLYPCDQCDYSATQMSSLRRHLRTVHAQEKKFFCDECDYSAAIQSLLKTHKATKHEGIRYFCDECNAFFTSMANVRQHKKSIHEGLRYPCDQCDHLATQASSLKRHKDSRHNGIRHYCDLCSFSASQSSKINEHKKLKHFM